MKLRNLKGHIRKAKHVKLAFQTPAGQILVNLVKSDLMDTLEEAYKHDGSASTGLAITPSGLFALESAAGQPVAIAGETSVDWEPTVIRIAEKLRTFSSKPVITNAGQVVIAGELKDAADDLMKLVGEFAEDADDTPAAAPVNFEIEDLLS